MRDPARPWEHFLISHNEGLRVLVVDLDHDHRTDRRVFALGHLPLWGTKGDSEVRHAGTRILWCTLPRGESPSGRFRVVTKPSPHFASAEALVTLQIVRIEPGQRLNGDSSVTVPVRGHC